MNARLLSVEERYAKAKELTKMAKKIFGAKKLGVVQKLSIKAEVNEPLEIELKTLM